MQSMLWHVMYAVFGTARGSVAHVDIFIYLVLVVGKQ